MTWFVWNIRGINKRHKKKELKKYMNNNHVNLIDLVEIRVKENNAVNIVGVLAPGWTMANNYTNAVNGRIWLIRDNSC